MTYRQQAKRLIQLFNEGSDLTQDQEHVLYDAAAEHCQILENISRTQFFQDAVTENIAALDGINQTDLI